MFSMLGTEAFPAILVLFCAVACAANAQQPADTSRPTYDGSDAPNAPKQIHVDQDCRILPGRDPVLPAHKTKPYSDANICHIETVLHSQHMEEHVDGNVLLRDLVTIQEHEFVVQNITDQLVVFVVQQAVPKGWAVDSDPQPQSVINGIASFPVYAQPGEIVRLHVGMRHAAPLRPKPI
jgi:hypothetical protein